ncbi:hypothetical protein [Rhodovulum sp. P5]|uniref:hypothetical protein n=1 Tax=Rhodovulum sp. P5 TaxID=1564506 RepID=UPI0012EBAB5D|nr:hypothetical protein [Rhodovulum sp. P5]
MKDKSTASGARATEKVNGTTTKAGVKTKTSIGASTGIPGKASAARAANTKKPATEKLCPDWKTKRSDSPSARDASGKPIVSWE